MTREERKEQREKKYAQRFLDYYNEQNGTRFANPSRPLCGTYDFDCTDETTGAQIAVEVTDMADELVEQLDMELWRLLEQVRDETFGMLPGTFILWVDVPQQPLNLKQGRKSLLREALKKSVCEMAPNLMTKQEVDLTQHVDKKMLSQQFKAPKLSLTKTDDEGSHFGVVSSRSHPKMMLEGKDFERFQEQVRHKNGQLSQAGRRETFLITVAEGSIWASANTIGATFKRLEPWDYCHIDHVYRIEGSTVDRILLPQKSFPN